MPTEQTSLITGGKKESQNSIVAARLTLVNFILFAIFTSTSVCCVIACIALATARLGSVGALQSAVLYFFYTGSALLGATYIVKRIGAKKALITGMALYCLYIFCYLLAIISTTGTLVFAMLGAILGGIGGGILWTAHGTYFSQAAEEHALYLGNADDWSASTSLFAGIFAFIFLLEEAILNLLSTALSKHASSWPFIFGMYAIIAVLATLGVVFLVKDYPATSSSAIADSHETSSLWYKMATALYLLVQDAKMKYLIGVNAAFGLAGAFLNSYVSGQVVRVVLHDEQSRFVGGLTAFSATVAAFCSLLFGHVMVARVGKGPVLILGALAFGGVALPFVMRPRLDQWTLNSLLWVYAMQGVGRATFESTLKSIFADYFCYEKEGAFANIILQSGLFTSVGFFLSFRMGCSHPNLYCMEYADGSLHRIVLLELAIVLASILAILGYWKASALYAVEEHSEQPTKLSSYRRESIRSHRSSCSRVSGHMDDATFAMFEQFEMDSMTAKSEQNFL